MLQLNVQLVCPIIPVGRRVMVYVRTLQKQLVYDEAKQLSSPAPTLHEVHFSQVCYVPMNFGMSDFFVKHIGSWMLEFRSQFLTNQILHSYVCTKLRHWSLTHTCKCCSFR